MKLERTIGNIGPGQHGQIGRLQKLKTHSRQAFHGVLLSLDKQLFRSINICVGGGGGRHFPQAVFVVAAVGGFAELICIVEIAGFGFRHFLTQRCQIFIGQIQIAFDKLVVFLFVLIPFALDVVQFFAEFGFAGLIFFRIAEIEIGFRIGGKGKFRVADLDAGPSLLVGPGRRAVDQKSSLPRFVF